MTGSLQIKNGKYYIVLNDYENGKRKQRWVATDLPERGNKRKAEALLRDAIQAAERQQGKVTCDTTFADYVRYWLTVAQRRVDEVTYQGYEALANAHILPYFDETGVKLQAITAVELQAYLDEKRERGRKDGKGGLSANSLTKHKNILNQTLTEAVKKKLIPANPCQLLEMPSVEQYESSYYTAGQMQTLFRAMGGDPMLPMVKITAIYGLRRSELLGLKWDSIDFESGTFTVKHTVVKVTRVVEKDKTKNTKSRRTFPLTEEARRIFEEAKAEEMRNARLFRSAYQRNDYVFKWPDGRPFKPDYVSKHFAAVLRANELPHIRFHELRHSCASMLLNQGFTLKDVQEWMGHADIKMTANIYGHLDVTRKQGMAASLSGAIHG